MAKWKNDSCTHTEAKRVFKVGKAHIWAGSRADLLELPDWALVISAIDFTQFSKAPLSANKSAEALLPSSLFDWTPPPCIGLEWPDFGVPAISANWWRGLAKALRGIEGNIGLCCFGGHGRTGTMLAILATLLGKVPVKKGSCPVAWVRKQYCEKAVESNSQLDYVERVTGVKVFSEAAKVMPAPVATTWAPAGAGAKGEGNTPANPTLSAVPSATLPKTEGRGTVTPIGSGTGELTIAASDEELLDAWFSTTGDEVSVTRTDGTSQRLSPVWDKDGELVGWENVA